MSPGCVCNFFSFRLTIKILRRRQVLPLGSEVTVKLTTFPEGLRTALEPCARAFVSTVWLAPSEPLLDTAPIFYLVVSPLLGSGGPPRGWAWALPKQTRPPHALLKHHFASQLGVGGG